MLLSEVVEVIKDTHDSFIPHSESAVDLSNEIFNFRVSNGKAILLMGPMPFEKAKSAEHLLVRLAIVLYSGVRVVITVNSHY